MPFYSHRRWYQPTVMGISYVDIYSFNGHMLCPIFSSAVGIDHSLWAFHIFLDLLL
jgi:hypothetical protein